MDPKLLEFYNRELRHVREMGAEFARDFPKIAGRLGLDGFECADPYVERLLEGFAFLAARVQLKLDAEFPRFTQHLLEMVYPQYLSPTPSMAVVQLTPKLSEGDLAKGFTIPRDTVLRGTTGKSDPTACEYRSGHDVTLWPLRIAEAEYFRRDMAAVQVPAGIPDVEAGIRFKLQATAGLTFDEIRLEKLPIFLRGSEELPVQLYEQLSANVAALVIREIGGNKRYRVLPKSYVLPIGFQDQEALLPCGSRGFQGYRLLSEYFAFYQRFLFVQLAGFDEILPLIESDEIEVLVLFNRLNYSLESIVDQDNFALYCTPAINLFSKRADSIHVQNRQHEHHVVPDRARPTDFEIYSIERVTGLFEGSSEAQEFRPFYNATDLAVDEMPLAYYTVHRTARQLNTKQQKYGPRSSYIGSEVYLSLVDAEEAPYRSDLNLLMIDTLCTNRDLPLSMPLGKGKTDFTLRISAPVESIRCLAGPTKPKPSFAHASGDVVWRLISHLSLNYLSLVDDERRGASALRDLLRLYCEPHDIGCQKQIEGVMSVTTQPITRQIPTPGPMAFGRGLEVTLTLNEDAYEGCGEFLLGAVLERFFSRYVSINSFTEMVLRTDKRNEIHRWPMRLGRRQII